MTTSMQECLRLRKLRRGDRDTIIESVKSTYIASTIRTGAYAGARVQGATSNYEESDRNFMPLDEIGPIIDTRVQETPSSWVYVPSDEGAEAVKFAEDLNAWAEVCEDGADLYSSTPEVLDDQETDGRAAIVLGRDGERVWFEVRDTAGMAYVKDPSRPSVPQSVTFQWIEDAHLVTETITDRSRIVTVDGKPDETRSMDFGRSLGMCPVVVMPRIFGKGLLTGESSVASLEASQAAYLMAVHLLFTNGKYCSAPILCPDPSTDEGEFAGDSDVAAVSTMTLGPGVFVPVPIKQVGGNASSPDLHQLIEIALLSLRRKGKVRESGDGTADGRSGKAMLVGSRDMAAYVKRRLVGLKIGFRLVATIWGLLTGRLQPGEMAPVMVEFADSEDADAQVIAAKAEFWLKMAEAGKCTLERLYIELQRIGYLDEDADPAAMAAEVEADQEEKSAGAMAEAVRRLREQAQPPAIASQPPTADEVSDGE